MDLSEYSRTIQQKTDSPLAVRMRPESLDEIVGQDHILGNDKLLYRLIKADQLRSVIFYGPPGTGKTTIAKVIARTTESRFEQINATTSGKKEMEAVVRTASEHLGYYGRKTILFIDEIHRFNKSQQDFLLPHVENGTVILIGATTENPYFEVNRALLSRSMLFELKPLSTDSIMTLLNRAVSDPVKGLGSMGIALDQDACFFLAERAGGDARRAINSVELAALTTARSDDGLIHITIDVASECIQKKVIHYDKGDDNHYDTISAFIKSMRGSDPDAAVFYLAKMLKAGEDIKFIARRIMICASEDVGNADPMALVVAASAAQAVERIGMPESQIILAHAAIYVASAPKSNAVVEAIYSADRAVEESDGAVPVHLRDATTSKIAGYAASRAEAGRPDDAAARERGVNYKYAHNYPEHFVRQQYLPDDMVGQHFYIPGSLGKEADIKGWLDHLYNSDDQE